MPRLIILIVMLGVAPAVVATSLAPHELPSAFAVGLQTGSIRMDAVDGQVASYFSRDGFSAYAFERGNGQFTLVQYDVLPGSQFDTSFSDPISYGGSLFMEVPQFYLSGAAQFTLHLDQIVPDFPSMLFEPMQSSFTVELQADAMSAGAGTFAQSGDPDYTASGNMGFVDTVPFICIECAFLAQFNLVFLDYTNVVLGFDFSDARTTLFSGVDAFEGETPYGWGLDLVVNQVPVPAALPLLVAALGMLVPFGLKRKGAA